ncbi:MAG: hypothetical protein IJ800_06030 [Clostridia bacterium]|nr:hypothetical protein [Clostridia bacterium]
MKAKKAGVLIFTLFLTLIIAACGGGGDKKEDATLELSKTSLSMNIYDEIQLTASGEGEVLWSSSDESVVKVVGGLVIALGKRGDAVVTAQRGSAKAQCQVMVRDRGISPILEVAAARAFVNAKVALDVKVSYEDDFYAPESISLTSSDPSVAEIEGNEVKGVKEGSATITVRAVWKNAEIEGFAVVTVYAERIIILERDEASVYAVAEGGVKSDTYVVNAEVFDKGVAVDSPTISISALTYGEYLEITGNTIKVVKTPPTGGITARLIVKTTVSGEEVEAPLTLNVYPDYVVMDGLKELVDTKVAAIEIKEYDGEVDGRTGVIDYTIKDDPKNYNATNPVWANWNTRLEFAATMTLNGKSAYEYIKNEGYKLLSFDVYYTGEHGMFFGVTGYSSYFYVDVHNDREDMMIVNSDGEITNTLERNKWQTVYLDLGALITGATIENRTDCNTFLSCNYVGDTCYIDDIRYWYDYEVLKGYENKLDLDKRPIEEDSQNSSKGVAKDNEFVAYSNVYVSFEKTELDGVSCYKYDSAAAKSFDIERRSRVDAYNDLNGNAVKLGYQYIVFDILAESGESKIIYRDLYENKDFTFVLKEGAKTPSEGIKLFENGREIDEFSMGEWISVAIRIDGKAKDNFNITSRVASVFYLKEVYYYKDNGYFYDYATNELIRAHADGIEGVYYLGDRLDLKQVLDVRMLGTKISDYEISSVVFSDDTVATYSNGVIAIKGLGESEATVVVEKDGYRYEVSFLLTAVPDSRIILEKTYVELYAGDSEYGFDKTYAISAKAYDDKVLIDESGLSYEILSGGEYITLDDGKITAVKEGEAKVRVYFESSKGEVVEEELSVVTFDKYRKRGNDEFIWGNRTDEQITFGLEEEEIGGRTGVYKYYAPAANASWNDRLMIYETGHPVSGNGVSGGIPFENATAAFENLTAKYFNYLTIDVYFTSGSVLRVNAPDKTGDRDRRNDYYAGSSVTRKQDNKNVFLYADGKKVTGTVEANKWYTMVIDHKTAILGDNAWTAIHFEVGGAVYFDGLRYYHDQSWMDDFAEYETLVIDGELESEHLAGESLTFVPTATYRYDTLENGEWTITLSDESVVSYQNGVLSFLKGGKATLTATVSKDGYTATRSWNITVLSDKKIVAEKTEYFLWDNGEISGEGFYDREEFVASVYGSDGNEIGDEFTIVDYDADVVELTQDNMLIAKAQGSATVRIAYVYDEDIFIDIKVTVYGRYVQKDGSEMLLARQTNSSYEKVAEGISVGGREGVYKFDNSNGTNWNDRLHVYESSHAIVVNPAVPYANSVLAYKGMAAKKYNFVSIDVYLESGAGLRVSSINSDGTKFATNNYFAGSQIVSNNSLIKIYQHGAEVLTTNKIYPGMWYTIVVDRKNSTEPTSSNVWSAIDFAGCYGVTYFDNIRYYFDESCYTDHGYAEKEGYVGYDGSEFVVATKNGLTGGYYALSDRTIGGRTGVYELNSTATDWKDKIGVYAANHMGTSVFSSVNNALNNMLGQNYKYVTFDIYIVSGGIAVSSPEYTLTDDGTSYTAVKQTYKRIFGTWGDGTSTKITRYKNGTLTDGYSKNEWYTVVVEYQAFANYSGNEFHGVDISAYPTTSEKTAQVYIDNVRYYGENPFAG